MASAEAADAHPGGTSWETWPQGSAAGPPGAAGAAPATQLIVVETAADGAAANSQRAQQQFQQQYYSQEEQPWWEPPQQQWTSQPRGPWSVQSQAPSNNMYATGWQNWSPWNSGGQDARQSSWWDDPQWGSRSSHAWQGHFGREPESWAQRSWHRSESDSPPRTPEREREPRDERRAEKDVEAPEWDGKSVPLLTYLRQVDLWEAETRVAPERRGVRLLARLKGDAFDKLEMVKPMDLRGDDSVANFVRLIKERYEPVEYWRAGKIMDGFMHHFERRSDEEILD